MTKDEVMQILRTLPIHRNQAPEIKKLAKAAKEAGFEALDEFILSLAEQSKKPAALVSNLFAPLMDDVSLHPKWGVRVTDAGDGAIIYAGTEATEQLWKAASRDKLGVDEYVRTRWDRDARRPRAQKKIRPTRESKRQPRMPL